MGLRGYLVVATLLAAVFSSAQVSRSSAPKEQPFTPPRKWALVIGANDYVELGKLTYASADAASFAKTLRERFGFSGDAVELITDAPDSTVRPDVQTVTAALDRQLADKRLNEGDLFIFYFSGHGVGTPTGDYLLPTNATKANVESVGLRVKDVVTRFAKAGLRNVLFIVDACRGGDKNTFGDDLRALGRQANIAVFLSCEPGTRSYEYPQFGHGAFTNFLLKELKSKDLQSPASGALWASKVIERVRQDVRDYTERDYPGHAQTPSGWSEATMDVLLGAFPERGQAKLKLADFQDEAKKLSQDGYADALAAYGGDLFDQDRYADAVEVWRAGDALRRLTPMERMNLSFALHFMGRTFEADNELAKMDRSDPDNLYTWISRIYNPSRKVTPAQRVEAAKKIWGAAKFEWSGYVVWAALQIYASDADTRTFLKEFLTQAELEPRMRSYFEGFALADEGKWSEAAVKWEVARKTEGVHPDESLIDAAVYQSIVMQGKTDQLEPFLVARTKSPANRKATWHLLLATYYKDVHQTEKMMVALKEALDKEVEPEDLLWAIRIAGLRFPQVVDKIVARADSFPFSWKAMLAKTWVTKISAGQDALAAALGETSKFCDDEFGVLYECMRFLDETLDEALEMGKTTPETYSQLMLAYSALMANNIEQFGYDGDAWSLFNKFALMSEKFEQLNALYDVYLGPRLRDGTLDPNLRGPYLFAAMAVGDKAKVDQIWALGGLHPADRIDGAWLRAMYEALYGSLERARQMVPAVQPSAPFRETAEAFRAYLAVRSGQAADLAAMAARFKGHSAALHWIAQGYVAKGDWAKAGPMLEEVAFQRELGSFFLQAKSVQVLFAHLLEQKRFNDANAIAFKVMISGYGNPLYHDIHFGKSTELESFAGKISLDAAEFEVPVEMEHGTLDLTIGTDGKVSGSSVMAGRKRSITGQVDKFGNLRATLLDGAKKWAMTGKVAQPSLYQTMPEFKTSAQAFLLLDAKAQSRFLLGRAK